MIAGQTEKRRTAIAPSEAGALQEVKVLARSLMIFIMAEFGQCLWLARFNFAALAPNCVVLAP
jgi:hypothetical protein